MEKEIQKQLTRDSVMVTPSISLSKEEKDIRGKVGYNSWKIRSYNIRSEPWNYGRTKTCHSNWATMRSVNHLTKRSLTMIYWNPQGQSDGECHTVWNSILRVIVYSGVSCCYQVIVHIIQLTGIRYVQMKTKRFHHKKLFWTVTASIISLPYMFCALFTVFISMPPSHWYSDSERFTI